MRLQLGTLVEINDPSQNMQKLKGVVLSHNGNTVAFRIVANDFMGHATYITNTWNCTVLGMYNGKLY